MDISYLREFVELMKYRSSVRAAMELNISPSTLSRHMAALERELDCQLLSHGNKTEFTQAAYAIAPAAVEAIKAVDAVRDAVPREAAPKTKPFRVFCVESSVICPELFAIALESLQRYRDVTIVDVPRVEGTLANALSSGEIDAVFGPSFHVERDDGLEYHEILQDPLMVCVNKESDLVRVAGDAESITLDMLAGHSLLVTVDPVMRAGFDAAIDAIVGSGVGIKREDIFVNSKREYYLNITGNRFFTFGTVGMRMIPAVILSRFRIYRLDDERLNANRGLTVRAKESSVAFLRLVAALEGARERYPLT